MGFIAYRFIKLWGGFEYDETLHQNECNYKSNSRYSFVILTLSLSISIIVGISNITPEAK